MIRYGTTYLPDDETHLQAHLARGTRLDGRETYQLTKYMAARAHLRQRRLAVDVGAHVGLWSRVMARDFKRVEAFEPIPEHRACWVANLEGIKSASLHGVALGAVAGSARMRLVTGNTGLTHVAEDGELEVEVKVLDDFAFEDLDFLKIDAEGSEILVLEGARATLRRCRPVVLVEENPGKAQRVGYGDRDAARLLEQEGARQVADLRGDLVFVWP